jgi:hypothetical protein
LSKAATDQEPPDHEQIYELKGILPLSFDLSVSLWEHKHKDVKSRNFDKFAAAMLLAAGTLAATSHSANSAAVTTVTTAPTAVSQEFLANAIATAITATKASFNADKAHAKKNKFYCWSHGINKTHDPSKGQACLTPHANHDPTATFKNKKGGKTTVWERGQNLGP